MSLKDFKVINKLGKTCLIKLIPKERERTVMFTGLKEYQTEKCMP